MRPQTGPEHNGVGPAAEVDSAGEIVDPDQHESTYEELRHRWEERDRRAKHELAETDSDGGTNQTPLGEIVYGKDGKPSWQVEAACKSADPDLFFPDKGGSVRIAKSICSICPVKAECGQYADANREQFGVWGGEAGRERRPKAK